MQAWIVIQGSHFPVSHRITGVESVLLPCFTLQTSIACQDSVSSLSAVPSSHYPSIWSARPSRADLRVLGEGLPTCL